MAKLHGKNAVLFLDDQAGACINVSGDLNNIDFNRSKNLTETTTFGDNSTQREVDGLKDATIDATIVWNTTATTAGIVGLLDQMWGGSLVSRAQFAPAGSITGCPVYTGSYAMATYNVTEPVDGVVTGTFSLNLATGSVIQACAV